VLIHIGGDIVVKTKEVITILDINHINRNTKNNYYSQEQMETLNNVDIKSIVITNDKVYFSPISSLTLKKRADNQI